MQVSEGSTQQHLYTEQFFKSIQEFSRQSAEEIVPLIQELIPCNSVVDVGCGDGTWLKIFAKYGTQEILGIDGDYVNRDILVIPQEQFIPFNLTKAIRLNGKFDLAISLEVAEHLPAESAEDFVGSLINLSPVVLFSAAIPGQGGENHINEQWQDYWADLFCQKGYVVVDYLRPKLWRNPNVAYWYSQNILLFIQKDYLECHDLVKKKISPFLVADSASLAVVHPLLYQIKTGMVPFPGQTYLDETASSPSKSLRQTLAKFLRNKS